MRFPLSLTHRPVHQVTSRGSSSTPIETPHWSEPQLGVHVWWFSSQARHLNQRHRSEVPDLFAGVRRRHRSMLYVAERHVLRSVFGRICISPSRIERRAWRGCGITLFGKPSPRPLSMLILEQPALFCPSGRLCNFLPFKENRRSGPLRQGLTRMSFIGHLARKDGSM